jgi:hypothetical protein
MSTRGASSCTGWLSTSSRAGDGGSYAELVDQPSSDRYLGEEIVSGLIAVQVPDLAGGKVTRLGAGSDHELFAVGGEWILRLPRRAQRAAWLTREIEITAIVTETLRSMIPIFERMGEPCGAFPVPSLATGGCRAWALTRAGDLAGLAAGIGALLGTLHRVDPRRVPLRQTAGTPAVG